MFGQFGFGTGAPPGGYVPPGVAPPGVAPMNTADQSFQRFQEGMDAAHAPHGEHGHHDRIHEESGMAPRRCSDIQWIPLFVVHIIIMISIVWSASSNGDLLRLTHGFDYKADLCGVDNDVADKPFQFWCRTETHGENWNLEATELPSGVQLYDPSCVASCPTNYTDAMVPCLQPATTANQVDHGTIAGSVENFFFSTEQSVVLSYAYPTELFGGRYCLPKDEALREQVLHSRSLRFERFQECFGSLLDIWAVMFFAILIAIGLGFLYIGLIKILAKYIVMAFYSVAILIFGALGVFFLIALITLIPNIDHAFADYEAWNPVYSRHSDESAAIISTVIGLICVCIAGSLVGTLCHIPEEMHTQAELMAVSWECIWAMKDMLILPVLSALAKFFMCWILLRNFTFLASVGWIEDRRVIINGEERQGLSRIFRYDYSYWFAVIYYIFGSIWILEVINCVDHFVTSYTVITWWYMPKDNGIKHTPPAPLFNGYKNVFKFHTGSLIYGALLTPYTRVPRVLSSLVFDHTGPQQTSASATQGKNCIVSCFLHIGHCLKSYLCCCFDRKNKDYHANDGAVKMFCKDSFNDIMIRSNNYYNGCIRVMQVFLSAPICEQNRGRLGSITLGGVISIGIGSSMIMYWIVTTDDAYTDPASTWYVSEPIVILALSFCICGWVAYTFCMLLEHTADLLLYCYAWNKKTKKATVDTFIPDKLTLVVGFEHRNPDGYPMYGKANPKMYLSTFFDTKATPAKMPPPPVMMSQDHGGLGPMGTAPVGAPMGTAPMGAPMGTGHH